MTYKASCWFEKRLSPQRFREELFSFLKSDIFLEASDRHSLRRDERVMMTDVLLRLNERRPLCERGKRRSLSANGDPSLWSKWTAILLCERMDGDPSLRSEWTAIPLRMRRTVIPLRNEASRQRSLLRMQRTDGDHGWRTSGQTSDEARHRASWCRFFHVPSWAPMQWNATSAGEERSRTGTAWDFRAFCGKEARAQNRDEGLSHMASE